MANKEHLDQLKEGIKAWKRWRRKFPDIRPDLSLADLSLADLSLADLSGAILYGAELSEANLSGAKLNGADLSMAELSRADLSRADLFGADLTGAKLNEANLSEANLTGASLFLANLQGTNLQRAKLNGADLFGTKLSRADLSRANLFGATLTGASLFGTNLREANLREANLTGADLSAADLSAADLIRATLVKTDLTNATLSNCHIYGISVWNVRLLGTKQNNLIITPDEEAIITVDTLEVAQFVYLLLNNEKIRDVINTLTTKVVLILGRFTSNRKAVLDAIREELRKHNYLPILFDFEKPVSRDFTETVRTLAHLSRFIIADLTDPSSIPQELQAIVPTLAVPVQPVLLEGKKEYSMFVDFLKTYHWVLPVYYYRDQRYLLATLKEQVIEPAEQKAKELERR